MLNDTTESEQFHTITNISLKNRKEAEKSLYELQMSWNKDRSIKEYIYPKYDIIDSKYYVVYTLPQLSIFEKMAGEQVTSSANHYGCFYENNLLISPTITGLKKYVHELSTGATKEYDVVFKECMAGLSPESNWTMLTDLGKITHAPSQFYHLFPGMIFSNLNFFKYFYLSTQFTSQNEKLLSNIVLIYKGDDY